jgi:hypothetical protein
MAVSFGTRLEKRQIESSWQERKAVERSSDAGWLGKPSQKRLSAAQQRMQSNTRQIESSSAFRRLSHAPIPQLPRLPSAWNERGNEQNSWILCLDGKYRRVPSAQSGIQPLAHGVSNRMGKLRGSGNAIVPQVAAEFLKAFMDIKGKQ